MRTVSSASSTVASGDAPEQVFYDAELRDAKYRVVASPELPLDTQVADTHAHLDMLHYPGLALARAVANKVSFVVSVIDPTEDSSFTLDNLDVWQREAGEYLEQWTHNEEHKAEQREQQRKEQEGAQKDVLTDVDLFPLEDRFDEPLLNAPEVRLIIGCHPHNASSYDKEVEERLVQALATDARVVGIGEIGLDYHYDKSPRKVQQQVFRRQIQLAHEYDSTIALHLREAHADGLRILKEEGLPPKGVLLHCYNLDYATLEPFLELGASVAFGGPLTFKKSDDIRDAAARCPLDRLVTETDCPFMAPVPIRGSICEPASVVFTADVLARLRIEPNVLEQFYINARTFFS